MAIALVAHTAVQSTTGNAITTSAIDTTGASLLVVGISYYTPTGPGTILDSKSNTWVLATQAPTTTGADQFSLYYVKAPTVGSGHTATGGTTSSFCSVFFAAFSGTDTSANVDQSNSASVGASPQFSMQTGSVTPSVDNEVLVTGTATSQVTGTQAIDSGFTILDQFTTVGGFAFGGAMAYLIQGAAAAVNPTWSNSVALEFYSAVIDTFRPAGAAPPVKFRRTLSAYGSRTGTRQVIGG